MRLLKSKSQQELELVETCWFARADGIAKLEGYTVMHTHPAKSISTQQDSKHCKPKWVSYFDVPVIAQPGELTLFKLSQLMPFGEGLFDDPTTLADTVEESTEKLVRWYMKHRGISSVEELDMKLLLAGIDIKELKIHGTLSNT